MDAYSNGYTTKFGPRCVLSCMGVKSKRVLFLHDGNTMVTGTSCNLANSFIGLSDVVPLSLVDLGGGENILSSECPQVF